MINLLKDAAKMAIRKSHESLAFLDHRFLNQSLSCQWSPVFILGAPRAGTTLIYQLMIASFKFAYIPNIANTFYMCPIFATRIGKKLFSEHQTRFESRYGFEEGQMASSESGNIWNRWFPHEKREGFNYTPGGYLSSRAQQDIYLLVANFEKIFQAPFITKNVKMSVRLPTIKEIFPDAKLIHIQRNPLDAILSVLLIRRKRGLSWWSVMPKQIDQIKYLNDVEQATYQVLYTEQNIRQDIHLFSTAQFCTIAYEELCEYPRELLKTIATFFEDLPPLSARHLSQIPSKFSRSTPRTEPWITAEEIARIENIVAETSLSS